MHTLTPFQNIILQLGGLLLIAGAISPLVPALNAYAPFLFLIGTLMFCSMQLLQRYEGNNFIIRRLRRQQIFSDFLLLIAAGLLTMKHFNTGIFRGEEWKIVLVVAAIIQLYTAFRIPHELNKENPSDRSPQD